MSERSTFLRVARLFLHAQTNLSGTFATMEDMVRRVLSKIPVCRLWEGVFFPGGALSVGTRTIDSRKSVKSCLLKVTIFSEPSQF